MLRWLILSSLLLISVSVFYLTRTTEWGVFYKKASHSERYNSRDRAHKVSEKINDIENHMINPNPMAAGPRSRKAY